MILSFKRVLFTLISLLALFSETRATHLRAGEITAIRVNCSGRTYRITVTVYIDTESRIMFGGQNEILYFGDSTWVEVPETATIMRPDLGSNMGMASFTIEHTYAGPGRFLIRYAEPFRNGDVVNLDNPLNTMFYIETSIIIDPFIGCDNAPLLLIPPIDKACTGAAWFHNPGAYDLDGDSLSFDLVVPYQDKGVPVSNYRLPDKKEFYDKVGIIYNEGNEDGDGEPTFTIDQKTGTLTWDAPGAAGEYNIAFVVKEWRKVNGVWLLMGYVERDMQIIVEDCENQRPELIIPNDICVEAGEEINMDIFAFDPDSDSVRIEAFSEVFVLNPGPARMIPAPNNGPNVKSLASSPSKHAKVVFNWKTGCTHVKDQPYQVVFKVTDRPAKGPKLIEFKTWNIRVVGPAPKWDNLALDPPSRSATVAWEPYPCGTAERMEVYRRVDQYPYTPPECVTGIPAFLGYVKVADLPISQTSFHDTNAGRGLAVGAQYCYRLVAVYKQPGGGESYVSRDTCLAPIKADAPVITNVSVVKTDIADGEIEIRWLTAFDVDQTQFPPPYKYEVWRAEGIAGKNKLTQVSGLITETSFVDTSPGLNTEDMFYNYRIIQYDGTNRLVDTSSVASSVRVEATPAVKKIDLAWAADVPWSNRIESNPWHLIYRGGLNDAQLTLIDTVVVTAEGFRYTDEGQHGELKETEFYCYVIETRGGYGNPNIPEPLINYSQRICAQPNDTEKPCAPVINITAMTCEEQAIESFCGFGPFRNLVTWDQPTDTCRGDIRSYQIWIADKIGGEYSLYRENVRDTFFIDTNENLRSFARCYKIASVDRSNNVSEFSEEYCFDNCPYYELPNVFTPNGDAYNELFSAFGDPTRYVPEEPVDQGRCARFVESVDFVVYNRWGSEVYRTSNLREDRIYIRWDGRDTQGNELGTGVYFYKATVRFITVDPEQEETEYKGWVNLIRG
jgi:hypothetical protein